MSFSHHLNNTSLEFSSSMDKGTKSKTGFVLLIFAIVFGVLLFQSLDDNNFIIIPIFILLIYVAILCYGIYETPVLYSVSQDILSIVSRWNKIHIPLVEIQDVHAFAAEDKKGLKKNLGAEGVLGNIGSYSSTLHKNLTVYTSRDSNWVLISKKNGKKIVISPDDLGMIQILNSLIKDNR